MPAPDMTDKYNTKLSKDKEAEFQAWLQQQKNITGRDLSRDLFDYDVRGWWKNDRSRSANGHGTDKYKKPNHPTFSDESIYHGTDGYKGGKWGGDDNAPTFTPSATNMKNMTPDELQAYFDKVEPNATIVPHVPYKRTKSRAESRYGSED